MFLENKRKINRKNKINYGYSQIIIFGLNFSIREGYGGLLVGLKEIKLLFQYPDNYLLEIPQGILARAFKRRLVLYGDKRIILSFIKQFALLRKYNIYTGKGIKLIGLRYKKKPGKVKRR